jgi:hypothetical protein
MGFDTHMIAGSRACSTSTRLTHSTITNQTSPHFAEALGDGVSAEGGREIFGAAFDPPHFGVTASCNTGRTGIDLCRDHRVSSKTVARLKS